MYLHIASQNLFGFGIDLPLQSGFFADKLFHLRNNVKGNLLFKNLLVVRQAFVHKDFPGLVKQFVHPLFAVNRSRSIGGNDQPFDSVRLVRGLQRQQNLRRRRRHADDVFGRRRQPVVIDAGHDHRHIRVGKKGAAAVNHFAAFGRRPGGITAGNFLRCGKNCNFRLGKVKIFQIADVNVFFLAERHLSTERHLGFQSRRFRRPVTAVCQKSQNLSSDAFGHADNCNFFHFIFSVSKYNNAIFLKKQ